MKEYSKLQYEINGKIVSKYEAKDDYEIKYFDRFGNLDKTEMFIKDKLFKVEYYLRQPPYEKLIKEHFEEYPNITMGFSTPKFTTEDGRNVDKYYVYKSLNEIYIEKECYYDLNNNVVKEIELDRNNRPIVIYLYTYDENNELICALENNPDGQTVGRLDFK